MVRTCDHGLVHRWQLVAYNDRVNNSISLSARRKHFYTRRFSVWTDKEDLDGMELEDFFWFGQWSAALTAQSRSLNLIDRSRCDVRSRATARQIIVPFTADVDKLEKWIRINGRGAANRRSTAKQAAGVLPAARRVSSVVYRPVYPLSGMTGVLWRQFRTLRGSKTLWRRLELSTPSRLLASSSLQRPSSTQSRTFEVKRRGTLACGSGTVYIETR